MKKTGCALLMIGFLWLGSYFLVSLGTPILIASEQIRSLPREQKTFTDKEVEKIIDQGTRMHEQQRPWLAVPGSGLLMLIGGLLLNHVASIRERQRRPISN
jgi:hypothetical protein